MFQLFLFIALISTTESVKDKMHNDFPWIGILRLTTSLKKQALTVLTVVQVKVAIADAYEMATLFEQKELRYKTIASFLSRNRDHWHCNVKDVLFHPEYNVVTKNTIAMVFLEPIALSFWNPVKLPKSPITGSEDAHFISLADKTRSQLILSVQSMKPVNHEDCDSFYKSEGLDLKWMRPVHYSCYTIDKAESCLNDAGMLLATPENGNWTLLGISVYGPGCSLPARFIDIFPYKAWIRYHVPIPDDDDDDDDKEIIAMGTRRFATKYQTGEITGETFDDRDSIIINKLSDDSIMLKYKSKFETYGDCNASNFLVYEEMGRISMGPTQTAKAVYSVSLYDIRVQKIDCVKINIHCKAWSGLQVQYSKGFEQEDWGTFVQIIPNMHGLNDTNSTQRIFYVEDEWMSYVENETLTVWLKFEIVGSASLRARYYGKTSVRPLMEMISDTTTTSTTTTTTTVAPDTNQTGQQDKTTQTKRTRRPRIYATHLRNTKKPAKVFLRTGANYNNLFERTKVNLTASKYLSIKNKATSKKRANNHKTDTSGRLIYNSRKKTTRKNNTVLLKSYEKGDKKDKQPKYSNKKTKKNKNKLHSNVQITATTTNRPILSINYKADNIMKKFSHFTNSYNILTTADQ